MQFTSATGMKLRKRVNFRGKTYEYAGFKNREKLGLKTYIKFVVRKNETILKTLRLYVRAFARSCAKYLWAF